jgi:hypothetical protein
MKCFVVLLTASAVEGLFPVVEGSEYDVLDDLLFQLDSQVNTESFAGAAVYHPVPSADSVSPNAQLSDRGKSLIIVGLMGQFTEYIHIRKLQNARQWKLLSLYQAVRAVESTDFPMFDNYIKELLGVTVVPAWFHQVLLTNIANPLTPEFIHSITNLSGGMDGYFKSEAHVARAAYVWLKYCVYSLSTYTGEPPCLLKTLARANGSPVSMWTLSLPSVRVYLANELSALGK